MNHEQGIRNKDRLVLALGSLLLNPKRMKHIESIQPELAADDITRLLADDDATATAALTRLLHDWTGCDIPQTSDLPESEVEELVPLCVSILRRHWQTPLTCLGDGITPMSIADLLRQSIGDRVQGNEALGIPAANANIPAALTALRDRHIADGLTLTLSDGTTTQAPDGLSLAQLLCTTLADTITELKDDNVGWFWNKPLSFANLQFAIIGCSGIINPGNTNSIPCQNSELELHCPYIETTDMSNNSAPPLRVKRMYFEGYKKGQFRIAGSSSWNNSITQYLYIGCRGEKTDLIRFWSYDDGGNYKNHAPNLVDVEIPSGACQNLNLHGLTSQTAENMYNHILCRLKQDEPMCGEGVTITLGTTNLDKLEAVEEYNLKLTELTDTYGYTFA